MPPAPFSMTLEPRGEALPALLDSVEAWAEKAGLAPSVAGRLGLVVEELAANVVSHGAAGDGGASRLTVTLVLAAGTVRLLVEDDGRPFDPLSVPAPDLDAPLESRPVGGLGLHLARRLTRSLSYGRQEGRNRVMAELGAA